MKDTNTQIIKIQQTKVTSDNDNIVPEISIQDTISEKSIPCPPNIINTNFFTPNNTVS